MSAADHQLVFVGGMHRSGTSMLADLIARHPDASGLTGTGVFMDEGQHIQSVYPAGTAYGGPGGFALHPAMHLDETSDLVGAAHVERLWSSWTPYWDLGRHTLVEKSPPNMLKSRLLQAMFPDSAFVMVVRHPVAAVAATRKMSHDPGRRMFRNWTAGHATMLADLPALRRVVLLRYEDMLADLPGTYARLTAFLGLREAEVELPAVRPAVNEKYVREWWSRPVRGRLLGGVTTAPAARVAARFGYDLHEPDPVAPMPDLLPPSA